jgi:hypothetical protein
MANDIKVLEVPSTDYYFERFRDAFTHTWLKFVAGEAKEGILKFGGEIMGTAMFYAFTPAQLESLIEMVFKNQHVRDFVLSLTAIYHARIDRDAQEWNTLVERLAVSYDVTAVQTASPDFDPKYRLMPNVYADRMPRREDIQGYLAGNRWLVVVCMIDQCITVGDLNTLAGVKPQKVGAR